MIDVRNITKTYGKAIVVNDVSLTIPRGGCVALVGPNGAGKSTLLSLMSRLLPATSGQVLLDGQDVTRTPGAELARKLAVLRQDNTVTTRMSVQDLVSFGRFPHSKGHLKSEDHIQIEQALRYLDLASIRDRFLDEISGGQRQRAFIAMSLSQNTDFLLLDEPLNNLDIKHAVSMMGLFRQMAEDFGKTVVIVLHDINFASCYADRIIALRDGRVINDGSSDEIIAPSVIRDIYGIDTSVHEIEGQRVVYYFKPTTALKNTLPIKGKL
jgi:iron complex transport system ATP-binding protein